MGIGGWGSGGCNGGGGIGIEFGALQCSVDFLYFLPCFCYCSVYIFLFGAPSISKYDACLSCISVFIPFAMHFLAFIVEYYFLFFIPSYCLYSDVELG